MDVQHQILALKCWAPSFMYVSGSSFNVSPGHFSVLCQYLDTWEDILPYHDYFLDSQHPLVLLHPLPLPYEKASTSYEGLQCAGYIRWRELLQVKHSETSEKDGWPSVPELSSGNYQLSYPQHTTKGVDYISGSVNNLSFKDPAATLNNFMWCIKYSSKPIFEGHYFECPYVANLPKS